VVGGHHGEWGARAYNGGLGAEPPAGSRGRAHGQEVRGQTPKTPPSYGFELQPGRGRQISIDSRYI